MKKLAFVLFAISTLAPSLARADEPLPYTEGPVWGITTIKVKPGLWEQYIRTFAKTKKVYDEAKKQGLIVSYKIISSEAAAPQDWNLMVLIEHKNMASLDGLTEKMRAIAASVVGDEGARKELAVKRLDLREYIGEKLGRELIFK
jgi:hypothetical protein